MMGLAVLGLLSVAMGGALSARTDGEPLVVPIRRTGSLIVLPASVRLVSPTERVQIAPLQPMASGNAGVRHFQITWTGRSHAPEVAVFEVVDGPSLPVSFVPLPQASTYTEIRWPDDRDPAGFSAFADELAASLRLIERMVRAQNAPAPTASAPYPAVPWTGPGGGKGVQWWLVRRFDGGLRLEGLELRVENRSGRPVQIAPTRLATGSEVLAVQIDHERLAPCRSQGSPCQTTVRLVQRTSGDRPGDAALPFLLREP